MMPFPEFPGKLPKRIDRWIDLPRQSVLGRADSRDDLGERDIAYDAQVYIAPFPGVPAGHGAVDEGDAETTRQRPERFPQHIARTDRLNHQATQLIEHRTLWVRLEVDLPSANRAAYETCTLESLQFTLDGALTSVGVANDLAQIKGLIRPAQQQRQNRPAGLAKQGKGDAV